MNAHQKIETIAFSRNPTSKPVGADARAELLKDPGFGRVFTDHMVTICWTKDRGWHDALPNLYSFLALVHSERLKHSEHAALFVAMAGDISWDGDPIPGMSESDASLLTGETGA